MTMEHQCWANAQYSKKECLEVAGIPRQVDDKNLKKKVLSIFQKIGYTTDPTFIDDSHRLGKNNDTVIVKFTCRKDSKQILRVKKDLRDLNMDYLDLPRGTKLYIHQSLCLFIGFYGRKLENYKILAQLIIFIFLVELSKSKLLKIVDR